MIKLLLRHNLIVLLFLIILLPGLLLALKLTFGNKVVSKKLRSDYKLHGATEITVKPQFDIGHIKSHDYQKYVEGYVARHLPLRSIFIRINNQIYYSVFKKSYAENGNHIIGKHNQLISQCYITAYCNQLATPYQNFTVLKEWADKIQALNNFYRKQGKVFIYLITPSKAEYMPEAIPARFHCKNNGISLHIKQLTSMLDERNVPYINGPQLMVGGAKKYNIPMFARGGIHWNDLGSLLAANEIIDIINKQSNHVQISPLQYTYEVKYKAESMDKDLLDIMNLFHPNRKYCVPKIYYEKTILHNKQVKLSFIGGSFCQALFQTFASNKRFSSISYFNYLDTFELEYQKSKNGDIKPVNMATLIPRIKSSEVIILEENSAATVSAHGQKLYEMMLNEKLPNR